MNMKVAVVAALLAAVVAGGAGAQERKGGALVPKGYRGMGVPISGSQVPFVKRGDRVDVYVTFDAQLKDAKEKVTATILQNVLVADVKPPEKIDQNGAIDLIVNPNEAQYLALAFMQGDVRFAVRAEGDTEMKPMEMAAFRKLFK